MTDTEYITRLQRHLAAYKTAVLGVSESGLWGTPARAYPHILPRGCRALNIVPSIRERFWREHDRRRWTLHPYFHHLSSSQALAFNLFFLMYPEVPATFVASRRVLGLPADVRCGLDFEVILDAQEGTNIDVLLTDIGGSRTILEIKLTERAFGSARADGGHLAKLRDIYRPLLAGRVAEECLQPEFFFPEYQLFRNLAQIRPKSSDRLLLLVPRTRAKLWHHAKAWGEAPTLRTLRERVTVTALEDLLCAIGADVAQSGEASRVIVNEIVRKYVVPAG